MDSSMKPTIQMNVVVAKACSTLNSTARNFECQTPDIPLPVYSVQVRSLLEYSVQAWASCTDSDVGKLKKARYCNEKDS